MSLFPTVHSLASRLRKKGYRSPLSSLARQSHEDARTRQHPKSGCASIPESSSLTNWRFD